MKRLFCSNLARNMVVGAMVGLYLPFNLKAIIPANTYRITPEQESVDTSDPEAVKSFIREQAAINQVNPKLAVFIAEHESSLDKDVIHGKRVGDGHLICDNPKSPTYLKKQRARGIWQISDCWHWEVPDETAFNIIKSTEWAMPRLKETPWIWSTYGLWKKLRR